MHVENEDLSPIRRLVARSVPHAPGDALIGHGLEWVRGGG